MRLKLSLLLLCIVFSSQSQTITTTTLTTPGDGTFKVPAGVTSLNAECWGAGGAGGGVSSGLSLFGGGGGGGGAYNNVATFGVTPATVLNFKVGAGGTGAGGVDGTNGEATNFSTVIANGGAGGSKGNPSLGSGGLGGAASAGSSFSGGNGGNSVILSGTLTSGAGGGGAGTTANGGNANNATAGAGGATGGGAGARGVLLLSDGLNGTPPGGGGSGASSLIQLGGPGKKGGDGGNGQIKVTYTCPAYGFTGIAATNVCTLAGTTSVVKLTGTSATLPAGGYIVTYNRSSPSATALTANATVTVAGTLEFTVTSLNTIGSSTITVTNLKSESCSNNFSTGNAVTITVSSASVGGSINSPTPICSGNTSGLLTLSGHTGAVVKWQYAVSPFTTWIDILSATGNTYTSGVLTQTTGFRAVVKNGACDAINSSVTTVTVNTLPAIVTDGILADICYEAGTLQVATLTYSSTNNNPVSYSVSWSAAANSAGLANQATTPFAFLSGGGNLNTIIIPAGVPANAYLGTMTVFNANCSTTLPIQLTIRPKPVAPALGLVTEPTCAIPTGSVMLNGLPATVTWLIRQTGTVANTYTNTGTAYNVSNLAPGNYTFSVEYAGSCTSTSSTNAVINGLVTNTYTGVWSNGTPNSNQNLVFASNYTSAGGGLGNINGCSCIVNSGVNVVISQDDTLTIRNAVNNNAGFLTFENNASLLQTTNVVNSGNIIYKRISAPMKNFDFTYWSSPVAGQTLYNLSPNTLSDKYFSFTSNAWKQEVASTTVMIPGKGYIIRTPKAGLWGNGENVVFPYSQPVQFIGVSNNGNITGENIITGNFYLIGNPYPSALNADEFLYNNLNNNSILDGTIYLWTHNTAIQQNGSKSVYNTADYASYNGVGGVVVALPGQSGSEVPSGRIASGQSFFALAKASGTIQFNNEMRVAGNNNQFFKPGKTTVANVLEKHRLWLNMTNTQGAFKQVLIGYVEEATNSLDSGFDGMSLDANPYLDFYSTNSGNNLVIQGRALPFSITDEVSLGYRSAIEGEFAISIDHADGLLTGQDVFLIDKMTDVIHNLAISDYKFITAAGTFQNRFLLTYSNLTLGNETSVDSKNDVLVWKQDEEVRIKSDEENIDTIYVYDLSGKQLYVKQNVAEKQFRFLDPSASKQILFIRIMLENGIATTKRIIF